MQLFQLLLNFKAVVSQGLIKERAVPPGEIKKAIEQKKKFERDPKRHTLEES
jgi:hypothetical protein